tara:strand:+ start:2730 stop:4073 length:1344 start_codon:yes stop_codon:yes gene_type:complete
VSCSAADWLDNDDGQGEGYTICYNPQCCLTWNGRTGDLECDPQPEDSVIIYSKTEGQQGKPIQSFDQCSCDDCDEDEHFEGACCYDSRSGQQCVKTTQYKCLNSLIYINPVYWGDGTCCEGAADCDPAFEIECDEEPEPPVCVDYAGLCFEVDGKGGTRCGVPPLSAPNCATTYSFRLSFPNIPVASGQGGGFFPCGAQQCLDADNNGWVCCVDSLTGFIHDCEITKDPALERWSGQSTVKAFTNAEWLVGTSACFTHQCPDNCVRCNQANCEGNFPYICPCCSATQYLNFWFEVEIEETSTYPPSDPLGDDQCAVTATSGCSVWTVKLKIYIRNNSCVDESTQCGNCPQCWGDGGMEDCETQMPEMTWKVRVDSCGCPDDPKSNDAHFIEVEEMNIVCKYGDPCYGQEYCMNACPCKQWIPIGRGGLTMHYVDWIDVKEGLRWEIT